MSGEHTRPRVGFGGSPKQSLLKEENENAFR
jgi:hypothetical protein